MADDVGALVTRVRTLLAAHDGRCTGVSARWCPVCGDCTCPEPERSMDSERCPLHSRASPHAEGGDSSPSVAVAPEDLAALCDALERLAAERDRLQRACDEGLPRERMCCPACGVQHIEGPRHDDPTVDGRVRPHHTHRCYHCGIVWDSGQWSFGAAEPNDVTRRLHAEGRAAGLREALTAVTRAATETCSVQAMFDALRMLVFNAEMPKGGDRG